MDPGPAVEQATRNSDEMIDSIDGYNLSKILLCSCRAPLFSLAALNQNVANFQDHVKVPGDSHVERPIYTSVRM